MAVAAWRKAVAEFVGAFTLIFIGAGAVLTAGTTSTSDLLLIALAHGLAIGVMVSALAHVSGGHFNPAVTFGALVSRQISPRLAGVYWIAQLLGGVGGAAMLALIFPQNVWQGYHLGTPTLGTVPSLGWDVGVGTGILVEAVLTFFLVFVIFGTGIDPKGSFNAVGGFAIGLTISIDIMMGARHRLGVLRELVRVLGGAADRRRGRGAALSIRLPRDIVVSVEYFPMCGSAPRTRQHSGGVP